MRFVRDLSISGNQESFLGFEDEPNPESYVACPFICSPSFGGGEGGVERKYILQVALKTF